MIGKTLLHYEITARIGAGGMGEVYRATDTKLGRDVAMKVLPAEVARSQERLSRFRREARVLAALNHPGIASIYGLEEADGQPFLVMELAPGEDLKQRLERGLIPVEEAVEIATQIAEALKEAHERGIAHRDLKPANIKLGPEGGVKILDFGLARAWADESETAASDLSSSPTEAFTGTAAGVILGTAGYMSPEQASGKPVDKRSDIWSFGVVLFEMLTGERLFTGGSATEVLAAVIKDEPDLGLLPKDCPASVRRLLGRCLQKNRRERLQDVGDARLDLDDAVVGPGAADPRTSTRSGLASLALGALLLSLAVLGGWLLRGRQVPAPRLSRSTLALPARLALSMRGFPTSPIALSPHGDELVFVGRSLEDPDEEDELYLRSTSRYEIQPLPGTRGAKQPFYSPSGEWVGFFTPQGELKKVRLEGGAPVVILEDVENAAWGFGSWGDDDTIVYSSNSAISRIPADGGGAATLTTLQGASEQAHRGPRFLPGARTVLFHVERRAENPSIDAVRVESGERLTVLENASWPIYASGHLVFVRSGALMAVPFDAVALEVTGAARPITEKVRFDGHGAPQMSLADDGTLVYVPVVAAPDEKALMWVTQAAEADVLAAPPRAYSHPRLSPDGSLVATVIPDATGQQIHFFDLERGVLTQLTDEGYNAAPVWTRDGRQIAFWSTGRKTGSGIYLQPIDGSAPAERLLPVGVVHESPRPESWSPDGRHLAYTLHGERGADVWILTQTEEGVQNRPVLAGPSDERNPMFSPDGSWLAYVSTESGRPEVYVQRFPEGGGRQQVSDNGGFTPVWPRESPWLFFQSEAALFRVRVEATSDMKLGSPQRLFLRGAVAGPPGSRQDSVPYAVGAWYFGATFDVAPGGERLLMVYEAEDPWQPSAMRIVLNWFEELDSD